MEKTLIRAFLLLSIVEGVAAFIFLLISPSMERNAWLYGYSAARIALGGAIILMLVLLTWVTVVYFTNPAWGEKLDARLVGFLTGEERLLVLSVGLVYWLLVGVGVIALFSSPLAGHLGILGAFYARSLPLLLWLLALDAQHLLLLYARFRGVFYRPGYFNPGRIAGVVLLLVIITATLFHWALLIFKLKIFWAIPGWFWQFTSKPLQTGDIIFPILLLLVLGCAWAVTVKAGRAWRKLLLLVILGYALQVSFGFIEGSGFDKIGDRFLRSGHKQYVLHACDQPDLVESIRDYDQRFNQDYFLGTKPPGVISFYIITQRAANSVFPATDYQACVAGMTRFMAYTFPLLALLAVFPLFWLGRRLVDEKTALWAVMLYMVCPNFLLMHLEPDQFLFPFMFTGGVCLVGLAIERRSLAWGLLAGLWIYLVVFVSFSLLPLGLLAMAWLALEMMRRLDLKAFARPIIGLALGFAALYILMVLLLDYNALGRYMHALASHRADKEYVDGFLQVMNALLLNNVEFAVWSGLPVILLYLGGAVGTIYGLLKGNPERQGLLVGAFVITTVILNLAGQTRGEVARLWIFMLPLVCLMASMQVQKLSKRSLVVFCLILILQLVTVFLTFKLQDSIFI